MGAVLECRNISLEEKGKTLLRNASIRLEKGEVHVLIGDNGAGKSMLMKCISGMVPFDTGEIWLNGEKLKPYTLIEAQKKGIYMVSHTSSLLPNLSIMENIYMTRWIKTVGGRIDWKKQRKEASQTLQKYNLNLDVNTLVGHLSKAQQKIIEIIKMLTLQAKVFIFDESFSELTDMEIDSMLNILLRMKHEGCSFFWITQRYSKIAGYADRLSLVHNGEVVMTTGQDDLLAVLNEVEQLEPVKYPQTRKLNNEVIFEARRISDKYILSDVSFCIHYGEILGITGMMGSGRTCLAKLIGGVNCEYTGELFYKGEKLPTKKFQKFQKKEIAYFPEDINYSLALDLEIEKNITLGNLQSVIDSGIIDLKLEKRISKDYGKRLGSTHWGYVKTARELSKGTMQKVVWARNLLSRAKLMVLDEPMKNLDCATKVEVYNMMNSVAQRGTSVVMLSSDYKDLVTMCDRVLILHEGTIVKELAGDEINVHNIIRYSYHVD